MSIQFNWYKYGRKRDAFSLIELLVVMLIVTILASIAAPTIQHQLHQYAFTTTRDRLLSVLYQTKAAAVSCHCMMELCGSDDGKHCQLSWRGDWLIRSLLAKQRFKLVKSNLSAQMHVSWRGNFKNREGIYFNELGETLGQQGRFVLQMGSQKQEIILTMSGRVRVSP